MNRTAIAGAIAAIALSIGGCVATPRDAGQSVDVVSQQRVIEGTATYRERIALPPGSTLDVRLLDISRADAPATVLASDTRVLNGEQVPLAFRLDVDGQALQAGRRYAVRATIRDADGALAWTTDSVHPVDPVAARQDLGPLLMVRVPAQPAATSLPQGEHVVEDVDGKGVIDFARVTVNFSANGNVGGRSGCNSYGGSYSVDGHSLTIGSLAMTEMACAPALMNQEDHFLSVLRDVTGWTLDANGRIVLSTADGRTIAAIRD